MQLVRIPLRVADIDSLIQVGRLGEDQRHDAEAIGAAVLGLFKMALEEIRFKMALEEIRDVWPGCAGPVTATRETAIRK